MCVVYVNLSLLVNQKGLLSRSVKPVLLLYQSLCLLKCLWQIISLHVVTDEKVNVLVVTDICYSDQLEWGRRKFAFARSNFLAMPGRIRAFSG